MNYYEVLKALKGLPVTDCRAMIFARKIGENYTEDVTVSGIPCVLEKSVGKPIISYKIYGNTVQNGTPSPENPVEVQSVGNLITEGENSGKYTISVVTRSENHEPVTTSIFLDKPLYKDDYIIKGNSGGKIHRACGFKVFDGSEPFDNQLGNYDTGNKTMFAFSDLSEAASGNNVLSSHFKKIDSAQDKTAQAGTFSQNAMEKYKRYIYFNVSNKTLGVTQSDSPETKVTAFKSFLTSEYAKGTPVTVYYPLANPTEESIDLPEIPTFKGTTIIETDTKISPENIEITYKSRR